MTERAVFDYGEIEMVKKWGKTGWISMVTFADTSNNALELAKKWLHLWRKFGK